MWAILAERDRRKGLMTHFNWIGAAPHLPDLHRRSLTRRHPGWKLRVDLGRRNVQQRDRDAVDMDFGSGKSERQRASGIGLHRRPAGQIAAKIGRASCRE